MVYMLNSGLGDTGDRGDTDLGRAEAEVDHVEHRPDTPVLLHDVPDLPKQSTLGFRDPYDVFAA